MRRPTLIGVIYPSFLIVILFTVGIFWFFATSTLRNLLYAQTELRLKEISGILRTMIDGETYPLGGDTAALCSRLTFNDEDTRVILYRADGSIFRSNQLIETELIQAPLVQASRRALRGEESGSVTRGSSPTLDRMYYSVPIMHKDQVVGAVETSLPLQTVISTLENAFATIGFVAIVMVLISMYISYYLSSRIDTPLKKIAAAARRYRDFDFSSHPYISGPEEVIVVSDSLRSMSSSLQDRIQTITRQKQELRTVLNGMTEAVFLLDGKLMIREINPAGEKLAKRSYRDLVGKSILQVIHNSELYDFVSSALATDHPLEKTMSMPEEIDPSQLSSRPSARAGRQIHLHVYASAATEEVEEDGFAKREKRVVLVLNDITKMINLERIRRDFVANVSHELKTPITSIKGFTETLLEGAMEDPEARKTFITIIGEQSNRLVAIIEDLLSLSRLEQQDQEAVERETISVCTIISGAVQVCKRQADGKETSISVECAAETTVYGNALLIEQALVNLIDNAVKYGDSETVVTVSCRQQTRGTYISVQDDGPGIPEKELERIFERFYRIDKARSRELGGTGLGLSIVKHIVISHEGEVRVESTLNGGSRFTMFFPVVAEQFADK